MVIEESESDPDAASGRCLDLLSSTETHKVNQATQSLPFSIFTIIVI